MYPREDKAHLRQPVDSFCQVTMKTSKCDTVIGGEPVNILCPLCCQHSHYTSVLCRDRMRKHPLSQHAHRSDRGDRRLVLTSLAVIALTVPTLTESWRQGNDNEMCHPEQVRMGMTIMSQVRERETDGMRCKNHGGKAGNSSWTACTEQARPCTAWGRPTPSRPGHVRHGDGPHRAGPGGVVAWGWPALSGPGRIPW